MPVALALGLEAAATDQIGLIRHHAGEFETQPIDPAFQVVVKHVGHHDHAALHPLAGATEFGVIELGHAAVAVDYRFQHAHHGIGAKTVSSSDIVDYLLAGRGELSHGDIRALSGTG